MKAPKLRAELEKRGLDTTGKKAELMERLAQFLEDKYDHAHVQPPCVKLTLDGDFNSVIQSSEALDEFTKSFQMDLAASLGLPLDRIVITSIAEGSVVVYFRVAEPPAGERSSSSRKLYNEIQKKVEAKGFTAAGLPSKTFDSTLVKGPDVPVSVDAQMQKLMDREYQAEQDRIEEEMLREQLEQEEKERILEEKKMRRDELMAERMVSQAHASGLADLAADLEYSKLAIKPLFLQTMQLSLFLVWHLKLPLAFKSALLLCVLFETFCQICHARSMRF
eukprot:SAG11_NODE_1115_length_5800_cov_183.822136_1_plen_278_part_10